MGIAVINNNFEVVTVTMLQPITDNFTITACWKTLYVDLPSMKVKQTAPLNIINELRFFFSLSNICIYEGESYETLMFLFCIVYCT